MRYVVNVPTLDGCFWSYKLLDFGNYQQIDVPSVVIFDIYKHHDHRYDLHGFFYGRKMIVGPYSFRSKKELYGAIQNLLQEYLDVDVQ